MGAMFNGTQFTAPDILQRIQKPKPGFDDVGGLGDSLRTLAGHLMQVGGMPEAGGALLQELQQRQQDEQERAYRQAQMARLNKPEVLNLGDGGVATFDYNGGGLNVVREPTAPVKPTSETERLIDRWKNTPPGPERDLIERTLRGYQYTEPVMQRQQSGRVALKQMPTYANPHPRTPTRAAPKPPAGFILD